MSLDTCAGIHEHGHKSSMEQSVKSGAGSNGSHWNAEEPRSKVRGKPREGHLQTLPTIARCPRMSHISIMLVHCILVIAFAARGVLACMTTGPDWPELGMLCSTIQFQHLPQARQMVPQACQMAPQVWLVAPQACQMAPQAWSVAPQAWLVAPQACQMVMGIQGETMLRHPQGMGSSSKAQQE